MACLGGIWMASAQPGLAAIFARAARAHPERTALVEASAREVSFGDLKARADALAAGWQARGIGRGDRVLIAMALGADLYASLAALWSLGATVVLPEPAMGLAGLRHARRHAGVTAFCAAGPYRALGVLMPGLWRVRHLHPGQARPAPAKAGHTDAGDTALISFTSGTSGRPKAIARSHAFLMAQSAALAPLLDSAVAPRDLVAFPVFALINLAAGRTSVLPNWKMRRLGDVQPGPLCDWMAQQGVTRALLPPSLCEKLADTRLPDCVHTIFTGGGPVFPDMIERVRRANPDLRMVCVYGSTEAEPIAIIDTREMTPADHAIMLAGGGLLAGAPVPDISVRIRGDEIQVAGGHVNQGYLDARDDAANKIAEAGTIWHRTGDAGTIDHDGRLWLWGRLGSRVEIAGRQIYPFSIEVAARQWPGVVQCALARKDGAPILVCQGDAMQFALWQARARDLGISQLRHIAKIPLDRRHASKIDRNALEAML